ncbi:Ig-like domain-containing protein [Streptomyces sp. MP131-18]|uniref:Ig-like domain-containing protein n=1 Tax=Streptomyces sp. MP131-18 TaxID=1857892 RepID=UPI0009A20E0E|nr:Ig-like domain-containing protein [Streptomyces sp. MP131-18]ONK09657.1 Pectate trisaccharide-lyase precursor [Streptomyces sp. MP131-18]
MTDINGRAARHTGFGRRAFVTAAGTLVGSAAFGGVARAAAPRGEAVAAPADVPAFPGAQGGGRHATGGRGGSVYEVTTLADSGPGSLRDAVSAGDRTVVFRVSGTIHLAGGLDITGSNLTIAGQTAPGDGICVAGNETEIKADNVILRYLRFRGTDVLGTPIDTFKMEGRRDVIIDHCSFSWGVDETCSTYGNRNVTVQWCIVAEGLTMSAHEKGRHGYGGLWGGDNVTFHHNLLIHNGGRNPRFSFVEDVDLRADHRNNVIYNYGYTSCYGGEWAVGVNIADNYYKPGPDTVAEIAPVLVAPGRGGSWYVAGNVIEGHPDITADNARGVDIPVGGVTLLDEPVAFPDEIERQTPQEAYEAVLDGAGAILPRRDAMDARLIADVRAGTGRMINSQTEVGGLVTLASATPPADSDHDGIPDVWERAHGLNPDDPADAAAVDPATGYTHLELYLNSLAPTGAPNPVAGITAPAGHTVLTSESGSHDVVIEAEATAHEGADIARVEFYAGAEKLGESTAAPYRLTWRDAPEGTHYLTVLVTDTTGTATTSTGVPVHVNRVTDLGPWTSVDIGDVPIPGAAALVDGEFTVRGSGRVQGRKDSFHFVYQPIEAPDDEVVEIIARVDSVSPVYADVLGGIMIRENLTEDSAFCLMGVAVSADGLVGICKRIASTGEEMSVGTYPWEEGEVLEDQPYWLRVTLRGDEFTAEISPDSLQWTRVGYERISIGPDLYAGLVVDANKEANLTANYTTARFSQVRINR